MPQLDKTRPLGIGSQTGRKQGHCSESNYATVEFPPRGKGMGRRFRNRTNKETETFEVLGRRPVRGRYGQWARLQNKM